MRNNAQRVIAAIDDAILDLAASQYPGVPRGVALSKALTRGGKAAALYELREAVANGASPGVVAGLAKALKLPEHAQPDNPLRETVPSSGEGRGARLHFLESELKRRKENLRGRNPKTPPEDLHRRAMGGRFEDFPSLTAAFAAAQEE